mmetsp:Transcript_55036/g.109253  ORF Transcript_55036/g.109253 Transcript_55036/m.109253 type:complete len:287 (+) Transcript_55036:124-984(+)
MLSLERLEGVLAGVVGGLEPKRVVDEPVGLLVRQHRSALGICIRHCTPLLTLPRPDDSVLGALHPHKLRRFGPVGLISRHVMGSLAVPACKLRALEVSGRVELGGVAEIVGLKQDALYDRIIGEIAKHLGQDLADAANDGDRGRALRESAHARVDTANRHEVVDGRIVVLADVPADHVVALGEAEGVEAAGQLGVSLDARSEVVNRGVHVFEKASDRIGDPVGGGRDARRVDAEAGAGGLGNRLHPRVEARVTHPVGNHDRERRVLCAKRRVRREHGCDLRNGRGA